MIIRGCKTIAEYAVRKWMQDNGFVAGNFSLAMDGNDAVISDQAGGSMTVRYDPVTMQVAEAEDRDLAEVGDQNLEDVEERA